MELLPAVAKAISIAQIATVPEFARAQAEWQEKRAALNACAEQLRTVERKLAERETETAEERAMRVAESLRAGDISGGVTNNALLVEATRLRELIAGHKVIDAEHRSRVAELRCDISIAATTKIKPAHRAAVGNVLAALSALRDAVAAEAEVRRSLVDAGYAALLPEMVLPINIKPDHGYVVSPWEQKAQEYARG